MRWFKYKANNLPDSLVRIIPYAALLVVILGMSITIALGRLDLTSNASYLVMPIVSIAIIAIWKPQLFKQTEISVLPRLKMSSQRFSHLVLLFILLYLITICLLIGSESTPLPYFCLVAVMAGLILGEILYIGEEQSKRKIIILVQIACLWSNLILGQTLKLPLYFGGTDIIEHMYFINSIITAEHITSAMHWYQYFPLFHIFNAMAELVTGMEPKVSYFLVNGLSSVPSILLVYLLVRRLIQGTQLPLIAALIYSVSRCSVMGGMYGIPRTMASILCLLILYLLLRSSGNIRLRPLTIFLIVPLVLMHQGTLIFFTGTLVLIIGIELVLRHRPPHIGYIYPLLFVVAYLSYWIYVSGPFFSAIISTIAATSQPVGEPVAILSRPVGVCLAKYADYSIIVFLAILGILSQLSRGRGMTSLSHTFSLFSLLAIVLCLPGPANFLDPLFLTTRLPFFLSPFIAFATAAGIQVFIHQCGISAQRPKIWAIAAVSLVVIFCFSSISIMGNRTDFNIGRIVGNEPRSYFTQADLDSLSFIIEHRRDDCCVYTDHYPHRYLSRFGVLNSDSTDVFDVDSIEDGYFLFREEEYRSREQLLFASEYTDAAGFRTATMLFCTPGKYPDPHIVWEQEAKIYNNAAVQIYWK